ncbi:MAG TPA: SpoIID/LytB domain-containing protein, partial [Candidatus Caenarcaniphilales bacterium]
MRRQQHNNVYLNQSVPDWQPRQEGAAVMNRKLSPSFISKMRRLSQSAAIALCTWSAFEQSSLAAANRLNPELKIGIVQRFGAQPSERLTLQATPGDRLTLKFKAANQVKTLNPTQVQLEVKQQPLHQPRLEERVILSTHRSFETAETNAAHWQAQGIEVEVAQPQRWQVWANRNRYNNPLLRRLLLQSLQAKGINTAFIERKILTQVPQASWVVNGYRYNRDELEITAGKNLIQVNQKLYAGSLRLQPNVYGNYTLVNRVPLETYLRGVVPHEIGKQAPLAAIQAQAIIARTYALRNLRR